MTASLFSTLAMFLSVGSAVFGYFAGHRGVGCTLRGAGHGLWGEGCEMLSLILELQACRLGLCFAHLVTIH